VVACKNFLYCINIICRILEPLISVLHYHKLYKTISWHSSFSNFTHSTYLYKSILIFKICFFFLTLTFRFVIVQCSKHAYMNLHKETQFIEVYLKILTKTYNRIQKQWRFSRIESFMYKGRTVNKQQKILTIKTHNLYMKN
jgi:hypothetical protein